jgi:DNA-binding NarL/FixJ family response regulator
MSEAPITVLLVDDHAVVRRGVRAFFETQSDLQVVGEAESGAEGVLLAAEHAPDVALMDLVMPGMDGVEATRRLKQASPRTQVIALTSYHDDEHVLAAIRAGATSYVLKDADATALAGAVRRTARGEGVLDPRAATRLVQEIRRGPTATDAFAGLSERERDVLRLVADALTNAAIAERLSISEKTVKSHIGNILAKLHLADRTQAAVFAWREGMMRGPGRSE